MSHWDQAAADCRCEWGLAGLDTLAPAEVVIVVDVLSLGAFIDLPGRDASFR